MEPPTTPFVTLTAASEPLGITPAQVERLAEVGDLESIEDAGRLYVSRPDVLALAVRSC